MLKCEVGEYTELPTGAVASVELLRRLRQRISVDDGRLAARSSTTAFLVFVRSRQNVPQRALLCRRQLAGVTQRRRHRRCNRITSLFHRRSIGRDVLCARRGQITNECRNGMGVDLQSKGSRVCFPVGAWLLDKLFTPLSP